MERLALFLSGSVLLAALFSGVGRAQTFYTRESLYPEGGGQFGVAVSGAGDVNNDTYDDVIVGAHYEDGGDSDAGKAHILSGNGGGLLYELRSAYPESAGYFGRSVSGANDVNNDGYPDVIVGAYQEDAGAADAGRAYIFSGQTGDDLYILQSPNPLENGNFGFSVSGAGDVNNDGYGDVIVGAHKEPGAQGESGKAYVFSGDGGGLLLTLDTPNPQMFGHFGYSVSRAGDVNNDGYGDVIVGASEEDGGGWQAGMAYIFSGNGGDLLYALTSPIPKDLGLFGLSVSAAGDVNHDSYDDVIVGACGEDGGDLVAGRAYVYSGATGDTLSMLQSPSPKNTGFFGWSVSGVGDVNNDTFEDVAVGAVYEDGGAVRAGKAYVFSGNGSGLLYALQSPNPEAGGYFGYSVSGVGDVNSNTCDDVIVGAPYEDGGATDAGRSYIVSLGCRLTLSIYVSPYFGVFLEWYLCPGAANYWLYRTANEAHFQPGFVFPYEHRNAVFPSSTITWQSLLDYGDPDFNWSYLVAAVNGSDQVISVSNRVGEFDFSVGVQP